MPDEIRFGEKMRLLFLALALAIYCVVGLIVLAIAAGLAPPVLS